MKPAARTVLSVLPLPGLVPDSLGLYLAALGLLRLAAREWPAVRGAWQGRGFCLVGGPCDLQQIVNHIAGIGLEETWTPYERFWRTAQEKEKKRKPWQPSPVALWLAEEREEVIELGTAHIVPAERLSFNPLLGSGGNTGRRDFANGWKKANIAVAKRSNPNEQRVVNQDLEQFLLGRSCSTLGDWGAASWFSQANKMYNSGQRPYQDGQVTPWAMLLACEALPFFGGAPSRRLGTRARSRGAFPFVTLAAAPRSRGEAGLNLAEIWAPLWSRPMTVAEVRSLFLRGRAEIGGQGATTPAAFAAAIEKRGVDAGIDRFHRFVLGQTTSGNTFESRIEGRITVPQRGESSDIGLAEVMERVHSLINRLPRDRKKGKRWQIVGLRGPMEFALVELAARREDREAALRLLDVMVKTLDGVDRNRSHRKQGVSFRLLPTTWIPKLFGGDQPSIEARLAIAFASLGTGERPLLTHRLGVEVKGGKASFPETVPYQRIWAPAPLTRNLAQTLRRRLTNAKPDQQLPFQASLSLAIPDIAAWLDGEVDDELVAQWLDRLMLFDWRSVDARVRDLVRSNEHANKANGALALWVLFRPLFDPRHLMLHRGERLFLPESDPRRPTALRRIATLIEAGNMEAAFEIAAARYRSARRPLANFNAPWGATDSIRLLAALLLSGYSGQIISLLQRWLRPIRYQ